ncbi:unnamed protein product [Tuber aestivum]|uniref:Uncharacterized protein n=1 Tax=Tuber aestivum TaxID=59557 RepID=A0A292PTC8_9PEZI|nr:unnamed protein product [Tuber aestivum]
MALVAWTNLGYSTLRTRLSYASSMQWHRSPKYGTTSSKGISSLPPSGTNTQPSQLLSPSSNRLRSRTRIRLAPYSISSNKEFSIKLQVSLKRKIGGERMAINSCTAIHRQS